MSKDTGGSAFPEAIAVGPAGDVYPGFGGMTLRDYFAAQALTGLLAANAMYGGKTDNREALAFDAFATADEMLAQRAKGGG